MTYADLIRVARELADAAEAFGATVSYPDLPPEDCA